jgi:hypothetical protein
MASGINSTFRQVGIATGIALLGTLFSSRVTDSVLTHVAGVSGLAGQGHTIATAVQSGALPALLKHAPQSARGQIAQIADGAFTAGLDRILLVAAIIALTSGVIAFGTIRQKDFANPGGGH